MCLSISKKIDRLINKLKLKFKNDLEVITCETTRATKQLKLTYNVSYIMKKSSIPSKLNDIKYAMFIKWKNEGKYLIVIGQNPSQSKTVRGFANNVDDTNWNIIKILNLNGYAGYIMLNTFPEIDPSGKNYTAQNLHMKDIGLNIRISKLIMKDLKRVKSILACTTTNPVSKDYLKNVIRKHPMYMVSNPKTTHFATQAVFKLSLYKNMTIKRTKIKGVRFVNSNSRTCIIDF